MSAFIDYFKQIARGENLSKDIIEKRYREFLNFIYKLKATDEERTKELIKLRFDYLVTSKIISDSTNSLNFSDIKNEYDKICILADKRKNELNNMARLKYEKTNPYRNLNIPQNADNYRINTSYGLQIENLNKSLEKEEKAINIDLENVISIYAYYMLYTEARENLLDEDKRRYIDEEISLGFNPNQELENSNNVLVSNLKYIAYDKNKISYQMKNKYGDIIIFEHVGNLEFGQFGKKHPLFKDRTTLQNYHIHKIYNSKKDQNGKILEKDFNIFTYLNINQMSLDEDFTRAHANLLFSDVNLNEAIKHNGGYVGEVEYDDNGNVCIVHESDKLSACIEFNKQKI